MSEKHKNQSTSRHSKNKWFALIALSSLAIGLGFGVNYISSLNTLKSQQSQNALAASATGYGSCGYGSGGYGNTNCALVTNDITLACTPNANLLINTPVTCTATYPAGRAGTLSWSGNFSTISGANCPVHTVNSAGGSATCVATPTTGGSYTATATASDTNGTQSSTINVGAINFGNLDWVFNPEQGGASPLFRTTTDTSITVKNFRTVFDATPTSNTRYTCTFSYRNLNDRLASTPAWTPINTTPIAYTTGTGANAGCTANLTKAMRSEILNHSLRVVITDTSISNPTADNPNTYTFYNEYIYRFEGAGVASGQ